MLDLVFLSALTIVFAVLTVLAVPKKDSVLGSVSGSGETAAQSISGDTLVLDHIPITSVPSVTPTPVLKNDKKFKDESGFDDFKYPNALIIGYSNQKMSLESNDDPEQVTSWYKEKIRNLNMNINNFIKTSANEKIFNLVSGANSKKEIKVEIKRENPQDKVRILVLINEFN